MHSDTARRLGTPYPIPLARLDELALEEWTHDSAIDYLRGYYAKRAHLLGARFGRLDHEHGPDGSDGHAHAARRDHREEHRRMLADFQRLQREVLHAEREVVIRLHDEGVIGDEALHRVERDLDIGVLGPPAPRRAACRAAHAGSERSCGRRSSPTAGTGALGIVVPPNGQQPRRGCPLSVPSDGARARTPPRGMAGRCRAVARQWGAGDTRRGGHGRFGWRGRPARSG